MHAHLKDGVWYAVLLSLEMPDTDVIALIKRLREQFGERFGIFVFDGQNDFELRLKALKSGADAYLSKPVIFAELEVILDRHFERNYANNLQQERLVSTASAPGHESNGTWVLQLANQILSYVNDGKSQSVRLTGAESRILSKLMNCPQHTVSRSELCRQLGPGGDPTETRRLDTLLSRIRSKAKTALGQCPPIITYRNLGFAFNGVGHLVKVAKADSDGA